MQFGSYTVEIKKREKVYFPEDGITKGELIDYYNKIADFLLPYIQGRPLTIRRFPNGIDQDGFFQKERSNHFPRWIESIEVERKGGGYIQQFICNNRATLAYLINQGSVELHPWLSSTSNIHCPDRMVFDLDPPEGNFEQAAVGAKILREFLEGDLGLHTYPMLTGSDGIHIIIPLRPTQEFEQVRLFAKKVSDYLTRLQPDYFTTSLRKNQRNGKLFLDYLRNSYGQTSVAPYSVRALPDAPVATPLEWDELDTYTTSRAFNINNILSRLERKDHIWREFHNHGKKLDYRIEQINEIVA